VFRRALFESYFTLSVPLGAVFATEFLLRNVQVKLVGQHAAVARLWEIVGPLLQDHGFNAGTGLSSICSQSGGLKQQQNQQLFPLDSREPRERRTSTSSVVLVDGGVQSPPLSPLAKVTLRSQCVACCWAMVVMRDGDLNCFAHDIKHASMMNETLLLE
jgi:hypothetical protein